MKKKKEEENKRMGKFRVLIKKIGDTKGTFHEEMGTIKDRNVMEQKEKEKQNGCLRRPYE